MALLDRGVLAKGALAPSQVSLRSLLRPMQHWSPLFWRPLQRQLQFPELLSRRQVPSRPLPLLPLRPLWVQRQLRQMVAMRSSPMLPRLC